MEANKQLNKNNTFEQKKEKENKTKMEPKSNDVKNNKPVTTHNNNANINTTTTTANNNNNNNSTITNNVNNNKETETKTAQTNNVTTNNNNNNTNIVPPSKGPLAKIEKKTNYDLLNKGMNPNMQEKLASHFRQFSKKEKEHLQQKKQAIMKKEKEGIFSEFKSFSKNFKLPEFKDLPSDNDLLASADKTGKELYKSNIEKEKKEPVKRIYQRKNQLVLINNLILKNLLLYRLITMIH